jgi:Protein of unknown function (DUF1217)
MTTIGGIGQSALVSATLGYRMVAGSLDKQIAAFESSPTVQRDIAYFRQAMAKVDSADDITGDYRLFKFVLSAFGLDSQINAKALMKKVLAEDPANPDSISNKLVDSHYRDIAKAFDFAGGSVDLQSEAFLSSVIDRYVTTEFEKKTAQTNPGVRLALYFKRMAPQITSWYQVLGDKNLYEVVRTALGMSSLAAGGDIDRQAKSLEKRVGIENLKDPKFLDRFVSRFLAGYDASNSTQGLSIASLIQPLSSGSGGSLSLSASTLLGLIAQQR